MEIYGIDPEPVAATTSAPGGKHESAIQRVVHRARAMLILAPWIPFACWGLALNYAAHIINVTPGTLHGEYKTPHERVTGNKPDANRTATLVRVFGARVTYGATKQQRATQTKKKLSALTQTMHFVGVQGNQILLLNKDNQVETGQLQRAEFHEMIYTERTPPRQDNPLTLVDQDRENYLDVLQAQGLIGKEGDPDITVRGHYDKLTTPGQIAKRIADRFEKVTLGTAAKHIFKDHIMDDSLSVSSNVIPQEAGLPSQNTSKEVPTTVQIDTGEHVQEPIATRTRGSQDAQTNPTEKEQQEEHTARVPTPKEIKDKVMEWKDVELYDEDGRVYRVTDASIRRKKGGGEEWYLRIEDPEGHGSSRSERVIMHQLKANAESDEEMEDAEESEEQIPSDRPEESIAKRTRSRQRAVNAIIMALQTTGDESKVKDEGVKPMKSWPNPKSAYDCLAAPDYKGWVGAMRSERDSWHKLNVFKVIHKKDRDPQHNTYPLQDIYCRKWLSATGLFDKWKCRLVAMGNLFKKGIDHISSVWSPTISAMAVRIFFHTACQENKRLFKFDVKTAFLLAITSANWYAFYPTLFRLADMSDEEIEQMREIILNGTAEEKTKLKRKLRAKVDPKDPRVLAILKSVYGDPAGNRMFWIHFCQLLGDIGFKPTLSEPCLYQRHEDDGSITRLMTHCDDGICSVDDDKMESLITQIEDMAEVTIDRDPDEFTGIHFTYDREQGRLELLMDKTIEDAAETFKEDLAGIYKTKAPVKAGTILAEATDEEAEHAKQLPFQKLNGMLTWITIIKVECACIVSMLGSRMSKWNEDHYKTALGVLQWMYTHRKEGIVFHRTEDYDKHNCLFAFADADLAGDVETRKSRSGKLIMIGSRTKATLISAKSALQKLISLSTTASEIISLMDTVSDVIAARLLLKEMHMEQTSETQVYEDNQPVIALVRDQTRMVGATKHTDMRHMRLREIMDSGTFSLDYCETKNMLADIFTKNLPWPIFHRLADYITGRRGDNTSAEMFKEDRAFIISFHKNPET